jgi:Zn-dependent protease with chaperone function
MREPPSILALLTFAYGGAAAGLLAAFVVRGWTCRRGRSPSSLEATWCVLLPALAVLALPALSMLQPHGESFTGLHALWHSWEQAIHTSAVGHALLHVANFLVLLFALCCVVRTVYALAQIQAFGASLRAAAHQDPRQVEARPLFRLPSPHPACFTLGIASPSVYVTTGLLEQVSPRDCEAILAHEAAHISRRDGLIKAFLLAFYHLLPLPGSDLLRADWERAAERECDALAARRIGSPCDVAAALVRVARLAGPIPVPAVSCFAAGDDVEGRVQALLSGPAEGTLGPAARAAESSLLALISLGIVFAASFWVRDAVELFVHH